MPPALSDENAVTMVTVHKAKGLEWPVVFVPAIYRGNFPSQAVGGFDNPYRKAETVPWDWRIDPPDHVPITPGMDAAAVSGLLKDQQDAVRAAHAVPGVADRLCGGHPGQGGNCWCRERTGTGIPSQPSGPNSPTRAISSRLPGWPPTANLPLMRIRPCRRPIPTGPAHPVSPLLRRAPSRPTLPSEEGGWAHGMRRAIEDPESTPQIAPRAGRRGRVPFGPGRIHGNAVPAPRP